MSGLANNTPGRYALQYRRGDGSWWTGHRGLDLPDVEDYINGVNARPDTVARAVDTTTGEIIGHAGCKFCGTAHEGLDGSCLL